jgi:low temperature requirement protein LtrA
MASPGRFHTERLRGRAVIRSAEEEGRAATPLELFFDLTFVVAVGRAAAALHHELAEGHVADGVVGFGMVFFAVWWGWMNFTWFASAHDGDDVPHRVLTLVQMAGVLVIAAGVNDGVVDQNLVVPTLGYVVMRIGLIGGWLRVARDEPAGRRRALRYVTGLVVLQALWLARLALPGSWGLASFLVLGIGELLVPVWGERAEDHALFHPEHIEERYGLFTIIVLGETLLSATAGVQIALDEVGVTDDLVTVGFGGLLFAFAAWWIYFDHPGHLTPTPDVAFRWGYAHVLIYVSLAAFGAGIHVAAEAVTDHADDRTAALAVAVPAAGFLLGLTLVMRLVGFRLLEPRVAPKLAGAAAVLALGALATPVVTVAGVAVVMVVLALAMVLSDQMGGAPQTG